MNAFINTVLARLDGLTGHLLATTIQGALLALLIYGINRLWKTGPACFKYALWCLLLAKLLVPVSFSLPVGAVNLLPDAVPTGQALAPREDEPRMISIAKPSSDQPSTNSARVNIQWTRDGILGLIWLAGFTSLLATTFIRYRRLSRLLLRSANPAPEWVLAKQQTLAAMIGMRRPIPVLFSESVDTPLVIGIMKSRIILPGGLFTDLDDKEQDGLILHELIHIKRLDHFVIVLEWLACAAHFFNPVAWWSIRRLRAERERACDDWVVSVLAGGACDYGNGLLKVVHYQRHCAPGQAMSAALTLSERGSEISRRIRRILKPVRKHQMTRLTLSSLLVLVLVSCFVLPGRNGRPPVPRQPGLYLVEKSGQLLPLTQSKMGGINSAADVTAMVQKGTLPAVTPDTRFLFYQPGSTLEMLRRQAKGNIRFMYFDPGFTGGPLGPVIRPLSPAKGLWELTFPQLASMRSCLLELSLGSVRSIRQPTDLLSFKMEERKGTVWVKALEPGQVATSPSLLDSNQDIAQMRDRLVIERDYRINDDLSLTIPREKIARLRVFPRNHFTQTDEIWIAPIGDRLYTKWVSQKRPYAKTSQPKIMQRAGWMTMGLDNTMGIGEMWDFDKKAVHLQLWTCIMSGSRQAAPSKADKPATPRRPQFEVRGEMFASPESAFSESLKNDFKQGKPLDANTLLSALTISQMKTIMSPRMMIVDQQEGIFQLGREQDHPSIRLAVLPKLQPDGQIQAQVSIDLYSMKAPFARTDSLKQTRLFRSGDDHYQVFGPLKQDGKLVFTLWKLSKLRNN